MTPIDLLDLCEKQAGTFGLQYLMLTIPYRRHRRRIRLLPGLFAEVVGSGDGKIVCSVEIAAIRRYLLKHVTSLEGYAVELATDGKHEEAEHWFAQYVAVRDRLSTHSMWRERV